MIDSSAFLVDISPYVVVSGSACALEDGSAALTPSRVHEVLRNSRFLAAVNHHPSAADDGEVYFWLACNADGQALRLGESGSLVLGPMLSDVESALATVLECDVDLWRQDDDGADDDLDEDFDGAESPAPNPHELAAGPSTSSPVEGTDSSGVKDIGWIDDQPGRYQRGTNYDGSYHSRLTREDLDDLPDDDGDEWTPEPERLLIFSKRGQSDGMELAWTSGSDTVESGVDGDWSVFRLTVPDSEDHDVPWTSRRRLPSIKVSRDPDDADGHVLALVETRTFRKGDALYIGVNDAVHVQPVFPPSEVSPEAQNILTLLLNEHLDPSADTAKLLTEPGLDVDGMRLHTALASNFPATTEQRIEEFLLSLGLPASLVHPAVHEQPLPQAKTYTRRHIWSNLKQVILDGNGSLQPRGRHGVYRRCEDFLIAHPKFALMTSGVQAVVGAGMISTSWPGGGWKSAVMVAGVLVTLDAVADALITRARMRRRHRH
ncbi:MAG: hypothetical protein ACTH9H_09235 [Galactobacter sp.]